MKAKLTYLLTRLVVLTSSMMAIAAVASVVLLSERNPILTAMPPYLEWKAPTLRENGTELLKEDLGCFEIRAFNGIELIIWHTVLGPEATTQSVIEPESLGAEKYEITACDVDGLYSDWVEIKPKTGPVEDTDPPLPPGQGWLE